MSDEYHSHDSPAEIIDAAVRMQRENVHLLPPEREKALLGQAGFRDLRLFTAACGSLAGSRRSEGTLRARAPGQKFRIEEV
jgi:hypothetical protein